MFKLVGSFSVDIVQSDSFLCKPTDEHNRAAFACELTLSRFATIIVNVSVLFEYLPVVWVAYKESPEVAMQYIGTSPVNYSAAIEAWKREGLLFS